MKSEERGAALFLAIGLLAVLGTLSAVFYAGIHRQLRTHHDTEHETEALHIAEGGVHYAIARLRQDSGYRGKDSAELGEGRFAVTVEAGDRANAFTITSAGWPSREAGDDRRVTIEARIRLNGKAFAIEDWRRIRRGYNPAS